MAIVDTVLHEMVHYYNSISGVVDCDENGVHNKKFRDAAMAHGLDCRYREETGWAVTAISVPGWLTIEEQLTERDRCARPAGGHVEEAQAGHHDRGSYSGMERPTVPAPAIVAVLTAL